MEIEPFEPVGIDDRIVQSRPWHAAGEIQVGKTIEGLIVDRAGALGYQIGKASGGRAWDSLRRSAITPDQEDRQDRQQISFHFSPLESRNCISPTC